MAYYRYKIVFNKSTFGGLLRWPIFVRLAVDASQICEILRKFQRIAVQGHPRTPILVSIESSYAISYQSLIVTIVVSPTIFENSWFSPHHPCLTPPGGGTPCDINVVYTPLKSTFNGLQFCRRYTCLSSII